MINSIVAHAIPRHDNQKQDGIHLLWTSPFAAGYSIDGYDIRRLDQRFAPKLNCRRLSESELARLHRIHHIDISFAQIYYRQTACPSPPQSPHDEPYKEDIPPRILHTNVDFQKMEPGRGENPRHEQDVKFLVGYHRDTRSPTQIVVSRYIQGLDIGNSLNITLPRPANKIQLTLTTFSRRVGVIVYRNDEILSKHAIRYDGDPDTLIFEHQNMTHIKIIAPENQSILQSIQIQYEAARDRFTPRAAVPVTLAAATTNVPTSLQNCARYDIKFEESHYFVTVRMGVPAYAVALLGGKAVAVRLVDSDGIIDFRPEQTDHVIIYTGSPVREMEICMDSPSDEFPDELWKGAPLIAKNIQMPLHNLDGSLSNAADENALAASRLFGSETFSAADFQEVATVLNGLARDARVSPMWLSLMTRENTDDPFIELRGWSFAMTAIMHAQWRRMLGFGFLDPGDKLTPGQTYHYRITGRFRRRDLEEKIYGFHTIPAGTILPVQFDMGELSFILSAPGEVELLPEPAVNALHAVGRKGIRIIDSVDFGVSLTIQFPEPIQELVLELGNIGIHTLKYEVTGTGIFPGFTSTFQDTIPLQARVELSFPEPIDRMVIWGNGFLYAIRLKETPGGDPEEILERHTYVMNVVYQDSAPPDPPLAFGTSNLQEPILPGDPQITVQNPPNELGFRLQWLPPLRAGAVYLQFPDLETALPGDVMGYEIERRRVDTGGDFAPIDPEKTLYAGNRGHRKDVEVIEPGVDLLRLFPETDEPVPPIDPYMSVDDVLTDPEGAVEPPGSLHQYRIFSVDALGRRSITPRIGSIVRLEKHVPPPLPVAPTTSLPDDVAVPAGVRARLIQVSDPNINDADADILGNSENVIILEWAWRAEERKSDPYATEFRLYWHSVPPDRIEGRLLGTVANVGGLLEMRADLNQNVPADRLKGQKIFAGNYLYRVESNGAGMTDMLIRFHPNIQNPSTIPQPSNFVITPLLDGSEQRPRVWTERVHVVPITTQENYSFVFRDLITLNADHPRERVWVGVSAADDQNYIADEIPAAQPNGGRSGNESSIAIVAIAGRYIGQPIFTVPDPLPDVPEILTREPVLESIDIRLDLPTLMPDVIIPANHRIRVERVPSSTLVQRIRALADDDIQATLPGNTTVTYRLANPDDHTDFLAQLRGGVPGRIEGRFLMDFLIRFRAQVGRLWEHTTLESAVDFAPVTDFLPPDPERYFYRLRLVDSVGHESTGDALMPYIVRVISLRMPAIPDIRVSNSDDDQLEITVVVNDTYDLQWVLLFEVTADASSPLDEGITEKAQLLRLPNGLDLYPDDGIRLRLRNNTMLTPALAMDVNDEEQNGRERHLTTIFTAGFEKRVSLWAVSLTRDGINSRFVGPYNVITGLLPIVAPTLTVINNAGNDTATWGAVMPPSSEVSLQRSVDGGSTWKRVSPWFPATITEYTVRAASGSRLYRLALRAQGGRDAVSSEVSPG